MYSYDERKKQSNYTLKYGRRAAQVIRELGYPNRVTLRHWYYDFKKTRIVPRDTKKVNPNTPCSNKSLQFSITLITAGI